MWTSHEAVVRPVVRVVLEEGPHNWSAYVPSVPGCVSTGKTREEVQRNIEEALTGHLDDMHDVALREEAEEEARETELATQASDPSSPS